jgi:hypothetical protein
MPLKERTPKSQRPKITPETLALFERGLQLQKAGRQDVWRKNGTCEYLHDCLKPLQSAFKMFPTHHFLLELDVNRPPPAGSQFGWDLNWHEAREVRLALEEALRESKARRKAAKARDARQPV